MDKKKRVPRVRLENPKVTLVRNQLGGYIWIDEDRSCHSHPATLRVALEQYGVQNPDEVVLDAWERLLGYSIGPETLTVPVETLPPVRTLPERVR